MTLSNERNKNTQLSVDNCNLKTNLTDEQQNTANLKIELETVKSEANIAQNNYNVEIINKNNEVQEMRQQLENYREMERGYQTFKDDLVAEQEEKMIGIAQMIDKV